MGQFEIGQKVEIPTSRLGQEFGAGEVVRVYSGIIHVMFGKYLGIYTISKHTINVVTENKLFGLDVVLDDSIPINEIRVKD